jgi:O-antigen/teichoic acid export membrane protein
MKTVFAFLCVAIPKVLAGGGQFLLNLVLIRSFGPAQFGALSVCLTAILLCDSFLGSAIDMAMLRLGPSYAASGNRLRSLQIQQAGLIFKPVTIGALAIPVVLFSGRLSKVLFQRPDFGYLIVLTMCALLSLLLLRSVQTYFLVGQQFRWYGGSDLVHNLLRYGLVALATTAGLATPGLVLAVYAGAPFAVAAVLLISSGRPLVMVRPSADAARELLRVLAWFIPTAAVGGLTSRMDVFFVSSLGGVREAGIFTAAQAVGLPILLLGTYLSVVFGPRIMPQFQDGTLKPLYRQFQVGIGAFALGSYAVMTLGRNWASSILFPHSYRESAAVLMILLPSLLAGLVNFPLTISLLLFIRPRLVFAIDACAIPLLCLAYYWVIPRYGALGAAGVTTTYAMAKLGVLQVAGWRLTGAEAGQAGPLRGTLQLSEGF